MEAASINSGEAEARGSGGSVSSAQDSASSSSNATGTIATTLRQTMVAPCGSNIKAHTHLSFARKSKEAQLQNQHPPLWQKPVWTLC